MSEPHIETPGEADAANAGPFDEPAGRSTTSAPTHVDSDALLEVETDKIVNTVEAPLAGRLQRIVVPQGEVRAVGELDANGLFYLESRGLTPPQAKRLMLQAFIAEAFVGAEDEARLAELALARLEAML